MQKEAFEDMSLRDRLKLGNSGYPVREFCAGRLMHNIAMGPSYHPALALKNHQLREVGNLVRNQIGKDFNTCLYTVRDILMDSFNVPLPPLEDSSDNPFHSFKSEIDYRKHLIGNIERYVTEQEIEDLSQNARRSLEQRVVGDDDRRIDLQFLDRESLETYLSIMGIEYASVEGFKFLKVRMKNDLSLPRKYLSRLSKVFAPSQRQLEEEDMYKKGLIKREDYINDAKLLLANMIGSGSDVYRYLASNPSFFPRLNNYSDKFLDNIRKLFMIDSAGGTIVVSADMMEPLETKIMSASRKSQMFIIPGRHDNYYIQNKKDRAIVFGIRGLHGSTYAEIRIKTVVSEYESEVGEYRHDRYKDEKAKGLKDAVVKSDILRKALKRTAVAFECSEKDLLE